MRLMSRIKKKLNEYWRVLKVTKKPDAVEYKTIVKVSALGMAAIGAIGFFIQLTWEILG